MSTVSSVHPAAPDDPFTSPLRWLGRQLFTHDVIFDFGSWIYAWMTGNPIWHANSARLLADVPADQGALWVLDLGAGPGNSALAMGAARPTARFIALDLAQQMLDLAQHNRLQNGWSASRLTAVRGDAMHLPLPEGVVDVVTGHSFLYLLPDYNAVLSEAFRVLRPGGYVAFLEPAVGPVDWQWLWRQRSTGLHISLTLWRFYSWLHRRFAPACLERALTGAGFHNVTTEVTLGGFGIFGRAQKK